MSKVCDDCIKADVCKFKEEFIDIVNKIGKVQGETNFVETDISCKKYKGYQISSRGEVKLKQSRKAVNLGKGIPVKMG